MIEKRNVTLAAAEFRRLKCTSDNREYLQLRLGRWKARQPVSRSGRTYPIESSEMIRPLRIGESYRAVSERAALQSCPCWSRKVRRGLQHNRNVRCAGNSKSKSIALHTEAGITDLELRIPEHWIECAPLDPTSRAWQVIDSRVGGV